MYICSKCGKQYEEKVDFCVVCGGQTVEQAVAAVEAQAPAAVVQYAPKEPVLVSIVNFLSNGVQLLSGFFAMMALALPYFYVSISSGYWSGYYANEYYEPNAACSIIALITGGLGFFTALASLTTSLVMMKKVEVKTILGRVLALFVALMQIALGIAMVSHL